MDVIYSQQDKSVEFVNDRSIQSSNPFAWQLEPQFGHHAKAVSPGGYCWANQNTSLHDIKTSERSHRIWENYFWSQGDQQQHFPPIEIMTAVRESKFERIPMCTYKQSPSRVTMHRRRTCQNPKKNRKRPPFPTGWGNQIPHPTQPTLLPNQMGVENISQSAINHDFQVRCFKPLNLFTFPRRNKRPILPFTIPLLDPPPTQTSLDLPDRYYDLGEEYYYVWVDGACKISSDKGDQWVKWSRSRPVAALDSFLELTLRDVCAEIYKFEKSRPGRYMSFSSQTLPSEIKRVDFGEWEDMVNRAMTWV